VYETVVRGAGPSRIDVMIQFTTSISARIHQNRRQFGRRGGDADPWSCTPSTRQGGGDGGGGSSRRPGGAEPRRVAGPPGAVMQPRYPWQGARTRIGGRTVGLPFTAGYRWTPPTHRGRLPGS